jgi:hypothetical protein
MAKHKPHKPFSVWAPDRAGPYDFETYAQAEAYAKKSLKRIEGEQKIAVEMDGMIVSHVCIDWRDRIVVDMTQVGSMIA